MQTFESLNPEVLLVILEYLDLKSIAQTSQTCKYLYYCASNPNLFKLKFLKSKSSPSLEKGPFFKLNCSEMLSKLFTKIHLTDYKAFYKTCSVALKNPIGVVKKGIEESSFLESRHQNGALNYDDGLYWSSEPTSCKATSEYLVFELRDTCFVFSVHFIFLRATQEAGLLYPSQKVRVRIGNSPQDFQYTSDVFEVESSQQLNTVKVLPEVVIGKYIMIELFGKVTQSPYDNRFYTGLEYLDCLGYPLSLLPNSDQFARFSSEKIQLSTKDTVFSLGNVEELLKVPSKYFTPVSLPYVNSNSSLHCLLNKVIKFRKLNQVESYFFFKLNDRHITQQLAQKLCSWRRVITISELVGEYLMDKGYCELAKVVFMEVGDVLKGIKALIAMNQYEQIKRILNMRPNSRIPPVNQILKVAQDLGPYQFQMVSLIASQFN